MKDAKKSNITNRLIVGPADNQSLRLSATAVVAAEFVVILLIMEKGFTKKEKAFFKRQQNNNSKLKTILIVFGLLLFFGVFIDALSGFLILRNSKSVFHAVLGLIVITAIYLLTEELATKINTKDKVSHPLYKRLFHLFLLIVVVIGFILIGNWALSFINS